MDIICGSSFLVKLTIIAFIVGLTAGFYLAFRAGFALQECVAAAQLAVVFRV